MKRIILVILLVMLLILPGCNDTNTAMENEAQVDKYELSEIDGWWHLNQDYADNYAGTWKTDGIVLTLKWEDGTEDKTSIIDNSFEVDSLQETFVQ